MKYNKAPIQEAIFDLRIDKLTISNVDEFDKVHSQIMDIYPNKKKQINFTGKIEIKENEKVSNEGNSQVRGLVFLNNSNTCQAQFRLDGFTFNMLKPYTDWDNFSAEAFRLWEIYNKNFKPNNIIRIAVRYINRIELPLTEIKFQDYILNMPPIPICLPQVYNRFFMQIDVPCNIDGTNVIITETIEQASNNKLPFILDIDAYKIGIIENNIQNLSLEFSKLRDIKNKSFENCITENTRKLFN